MQREDDGAFHLVKLPRWADLTISAVIVAAFVGGWLGFFGWLAATQG